MSVATLGELRERLDELADEHGDDTPLIVRKTADEGEYGMAVWHSEGRLSIEYDDYKNGVKIV